MDKARAEIRQGDGCGEFRGAGRGKTRENECDHQQYILDAAYFLCEQGQDIPEYSDDHHPGCIQFYF